MSVYAAGTVVPVERSRAEIERMLTRYKATRFASGWSETGATIMFEAHSRRVFFELPRPDPHDTTFTLDSYRRRRAAEPARKLYEQACRQRWRALALVIKAKLEAVAAGITTFEEEFLAHIVLPGGSTVGDWVGPQLANVYASGAMPKQLGPINPDTEDSAS